MEQGGGGARSPGDRGHGKAELGDEIELGVGIPSPRRAPWPPHPHPPTEPPGPPPGWPAPPSPDHGSLDSSQASPPRETTSPSPPPSMLATWSYRDGWIFFNYGKSESDGECGWG